MPCVHLVCLSQEFPLTRPLTLPSFERVSHRTVVQPEEESRFLPSPLHPHLLLPPDPVSPDEVEEETRQLLLERVWFRLLE